MAISNAMTQATVQHARQQAAQGSAGALNHTNTGDVPKIRRNPESDRQRDIANLGTRSVCDDLGTRKTADHAWGNVWRDHSGNAVPGPASGGPPDNTGVWTKMN
jgi:hypothetical protein